MEAKKTTALTVFTLSSLITLFLIPVSIQAQQSRGVILAGYNHQPPVRTSGSGFVTVTYQKDTLRVKGEFSDLKGFYRGAYIMVGEKGEAGNMLFRLKVEANEERTGGVIKARDNLFPLSDIQKNLLKKGDLFINISSTQHTRGELRGQIPPLG
ncbi:CHRD domain-containing protein [Fodinibius sediminis]|uniref:CHRD domain-containing protein n=1 Tax=Fodinibius sediminis TaxID=1214077 RepID=A0A521CF78_9BACT|nr:CHRD domain-containing protein [Fodinibius sediminis]SMO58078.1 CHRD domain-containing protein [Fodinibius sediminis]